MSAPDAAAIAAGLTKAQKALLAEAPKTASSHYSPARKLESLGLANWRRGSYGDTYHLTPLGLAVRAILLAEAGA